MRAVSAAASLAALLIGCGIAPPPAGPKAPASAEIRVFASENETQMTEGETTLDVDPDVAYATVVDYARWPEIFPDVHRTIITAQDGVDARVTFIGDNDHHDNLHFHNRPQVRTVWFEDTGGRASVWAETSFAPGPRPGTTRVHSRLYADVHGFLSLVITNANLRSRRETKVASDLTNLRAYFTRAARVGAPAAPPAATRTAETIR